MGQGAALNLDLGNRRFFLNIIEEFETTFLWIFSNLYDR